MNNLSWLIYAADVSGKVSSAFGLIATFVGVMGGIGIIVLWAAVNFRKRTKIPGNLRYGNMVFHNGCFASFVSSYSII